MSRGPGRPRDSESEELCPFGEELEGIYQISGITQTELATESGLANSTLAQMKVGARLSRLNVLKVIKGLIKLKFITSDTVEYVANKLLEKASHNPLNRPYKQDKEVFALLDEKQQQRNLSMPSTSTSVPYTDYAMLLTPIVGRKDELADLVRFVKDDCLPLVTLTGAAGVGKTRLAREVEKVLTEQYGYSCKYISLAKIDSASAVPSAIARGFDVIGISDTVYILNRLISELQKFSLKSFLLVIDNFEHLIDKKRYSIEFLIKICVACPGLKILVTSRKVLNTEGEQVYRVKPFSFIDPELISTSEDLRRHSATELFIEYVKARNFSFAPTLKEARSISSICNMLAGLPLAIKIVAFRVPILGMQGILATLPIEILQQFTNADPELERQKTLEATFFWSYNLLTKEQQFHFRHWPVFPNDAFEDVINAVCGKKNLPSGLRSNMEELVNSSLLEVGTWDGISGYEMLRPIHEFAFSLLSTGGQK